MLILVNDFIETFEKKCDNNHALAFFAFFALYF